MFIFIGTSLWFAPNAVVSLVPSFGTSETGALGSSVQIGFILGTMFLSLTALPDNYSAVNLFCIMGLLGSALNAMCLITINFAVWFFLRLLIGFCLSGIYPIGMKIASQWYFKKGLGLRLGALVGALTLGTAFPWLLNAAFLGTGTEEEEKEATVRWILIVVSIISASGAVLMPLFGAPPAIPLESKHFYDAEIPLVKVVEEGRGVKASPSEPIEVDGHNTTATSSKDQELPEFALTDAPKPEKADDTAGIAKSNGHKVENTVVDRVEEKAVDVNKEKKSKFSSGAIFRIWSDRGFRAACLGYFGHMWELYTFWTFVPELIASYAAAQNPEEGGLGVSEELLSFITIAIGAVGCVVFGYISLYYGSAIAGGSALIISGCCCVIVPFYKEFSRPVFVFYLMVWGFTVVADSAQFSALVAKRAPKEFLGTGLALSTCVGFTLTVISLQTVTQLVRVTDVGIALLSLLPGPVIGLYFTVAYDLRHCDSRGSKETHK